MKTFGLACLIFLAFIAFVILTVIFPSIVIAGTILCLLFSICLLMAHAILNSSDNGW